MLSGPEMCLSGPGPERNREAQLLTASRAMQTWQAPGARDAFCSAIYFRVIPKAAEEPAECQRKAEGDLEIRAVRKPLQQPSEMETRRTQLKPQEETGKNNNKQNFYVF